MAIRGGGSGGWIESRSTVLLGAAVIAGVLVLQGTFLALLPQEWSTNHSRDFLLYYEPAARRLVQGYGLTTQDGQIATRFPPGYPLLLAATIRLAGWLGMDWFTLLKGVVLAWSATSGLLLFLVARRTFDTRVALLSTGLFAVHPLCLWLIKQPNSEVPFLLLLILAVGLAQPVFAGNHRGLKRVAATGLVYGIAALIRPIAIGIVLPTGIAFAIQSGVRRRVRVARCATLAAAFLIAVAPWEAWVWNRTHRLIPLSTMAPCAVFYGFAVGSGSSDLPGYIPLAPSFARLAADAERLQGQDCKHSVTELLSTWARERPWELTRALAEKALRAWYGTDVHWFEAQALLLNLAFAVTTALGLVLAWGSMHARTYAIHALLLTAYFWGMAAVVESLVRYLVPAIVLLLPLTSTGLLAGLDTGWRRWLSRRAPVSAESA